MIFKKNIIEKISKQLLLPFSGLEQDWDLEMANTERINDFITFYESNNLDFEEKKSVLALIVASYNDYLYNNDIDDRWKTVENILKSESRILKILLDYWCINSDQEGFPISYLLYKIDIRE